MKKAFYIDLILPIPLQQLFTYSITEAEASFLETGMRVAVPFGKSKIYTGVVYAIHQNAPQAYQAKEIYQILDDSPIITKVQIKHWQWIADYYMCTLGEVLRSALPSMFLMESETIIELEEPPQDESSLSNDEFRVVEALEKEERLKVAELGKLLPEKNTVSILKKLLEKNCIRVKEELYEKYRPKLVRYVKLHESYEDETRLNELFDSLHRAKKQHQLLLSFFSLRATNEPVKVKVLLAESGVSNAVLTALVDKNILEFYVLKEDRVDLSGESNKLPQLSEIQQSSLKSVRYIFKEKGVALLHGVTSSGKTEIYAHLIDQVLQKGRQVLYLVPEIALTTQLINRLKSYFGSSISVFHSKYSLHERVEVWNNVLDDQKKAGLIVGARSAVYLPFQSLELIIVDEEHETSYKQFDPAPRYHARDVAIVLAKLHQAKVILGSATPSIESYHNAQTEKYGLVQLDRRHGNVMLPEIELVDIKEAYRKKKMTGHFSERLHELIAEALEDQLQVILFQNRRGYAPIIECKTCGVAPQCPNCDVSLTYHKYHDELRCHYCGYQRPMPKTCSACGNASLDSKGFGTEQIELELKELFPESRVARMDLDTTKGKYGYEKLITAFEDHQIDILVGTQMLSKGLDFSKVSVVGVLNADTLLNFPDFRAHERSFQMLTQVAGRAGRAQKRGKVIIQTFNPYHQILQQVSVNDYAIMFKEQAEDRYQLVYPPFARLIRITLKHKDFQKVNRAADWLGTSLRNSFSDRILGPTSPAISRIRNQHIKTILIKLSTQESLVKSKQVIWRIKNSFQSIAEFRSVRLNIDVDCY